MLHSLGIHLTVGHESKEGLGSTSLEHGHLTVDLPMKLL